MTGTYHAFAIALFNIHFMQSISMHMYILLKNDYVSDLPRKYNR